MKKSTMSVALAGALLSMTAAHASEFNGAEIGVNVGKNNTSPVGGNVQSKTYVSGQVGYNWDVNNFVLGVDGLYDAHSKASTAKDLALDAKLGYPMGASGKFMPYAKLGVAGTKPGVRPQAGLGLEYKFAPHWSLDAEYLVDRRTINNIAYRNKDFTIGLNYYFGSPAVAAPAAAVVAPVVIKQAEPVVIKPAPVIAPVLAPAPVVVAPAPAPAPVVVTPVPKTIFTDKPVTLEGANFDTNLAKLKPTAHNQLDLVVEFAAKNKEANLTVEGYTDSRGKEAANQKLSASRAESVKAYLVAKGVDAKRITAIGKGSAKPIGDNKTKAGQAKNRRVEIDSVVRVAK